MVEACIWERVHPTVNDRPWQKVAEEFVSSLETTWPTELCTLDQALLSVGYPVSGALTDSYETGTDITALNTALFAARVYMAVWRA